MVQAQHQLKNEDLMLQWVTFKLEDEVYGINVMQVQEVLRYTPIAPVPGSPSYVLGIINLRGKVVTVVDTRKRFDLPQGKLSDHTRIMIVECDRQIVGILVDAVAEVVYLKKSEIEPSPNVTTDSSKNFIQGVSKRKDVLLILLELNKMFTDAEWDELQEVID
jgi:purine-binding chemotaxis protein CheW